MSGTDVLVGMAFDPRREPQHQANWCSALRHELSQAIQIVLVISDHHHAMAVGEGELLNRFVVPMQHHAFGWHASIERCEQLSS